MTFCLCRDKEEGAKSVFIGAAVYPTLAMFNHSCDPSIVRYHINRVLCDKLSSCKCTTPLEFGRHQFYSGFMSKTRFASKPSRIFPKARRFLRTTGQSFSIPAERTERYELRLKIGQTRSKNHFDSGVLQERLKKQYWFDCACIPCQENWPLMHEMGDDHLNFKCAVCSGSCQFSTNATNPMLR